MWEIFALCALGRWGNEGRDSSLKTKPQVSWSLEIYEDIYFLRATVTAARMFVKRKTSGDVGSRKSHFFRWRRRAEMDGGRGGEGMGAASKGDL